MELKYSTSPSPTEFDSPTNAQAKYQLLLNRPFERVYPMNLNQKKIRDSESPTENKMRKSGYVRSVGAHSPDLAEHETLENTQKRKTSMKMTPPDFLKDLMGDFKKSQHPNEKLSLEKLRKRSTHIEPSSGAETPIKHLWFVPTVNKQEERSSPIKVGASPLTMNTTEFLNGELMQEIKIEELESTSSFIEDHEAYSPKRKVNELPPLNYKMVMNEEQSDTSKYCYYNPRMSIDKILSKTLTKPFNATTTLSPNKNETATSKLNRSNHLMTEKPVNFHRRNMSAIVNGTSDFNPENKAIAKIKIKKVGRAKRSGPKKTIASINLNEVENPVKILQALTFMPQGADDNPKLVKSNQIDETFFKVFKETMPKGQLHKATVGDKLLTISKLDTSTFNLTKFKK